MWTCHFRWLCVPFCLAVLLSVAFDRPHTLAQETPSQETPLQKRPTLPAGKTPATTPAAKPAPTEAASEDRTADGQPAEKEDQADPVAKLKRELDQIEARIRGDDEAGIANTRIVKGVIAELEQEYRENHDRLLEWRNASDRAAGDELAKRVRRQKIIVQHLIELDTRKTGTGIFDNTLYRDLALLQRRPEVRNNPNLQQRINKLMQTYSQQRFRPQAKKTIAEITVPLVGDNHLALAKSGIGHVYPAASDGLLQDYREHIKNLICLRWNGLQLELDRDHWDRPFAEKTETEIIKEIDALLADRGYKARVAANGPRVAMFRGNRMGQNNLSRLFHAMQEGQQASRSSSGGASGHNRLSMRTAQMEARLSTTPDSFSFDFSENDDRATILRVREDKAKGLSISTLGDVTFRFRQAPDGAIDVVELAGDETLRFKAPSFADLYRENVEFCELRLLPLLDHLGLTLPMSRLDDQVIHCVIAELQALQQRRPDNAQALIQQLGSEQYAQREEATRQLKDALAFYAPALRAALDKPLSIEARMRIRSLLQDVKPSQTEEMVVALKLLDDVEFLKVVQQRCAGDDQQLVASRIEALQSE